ncbi:hypothetical protein ACHQDA_08465 [Vibrio fluvialis]|uniref:hypothetical protein n=1 Tax=Vibrio fluvialis TaxID=676 RepID=UPI001C9BC1A1|nr:hypothetical protein [Vibrio fluvialis]MBY8189699.1 hypothetical protein [Vibrio fluvialis]
MTVSNVIDDALKAIANEMITRGLVTSFQLRPTTVSYDRTLNDLYMTLTNGNTFVLYSHKDFIDQNKLCYISEKKNGVVTLTDAVCIDCSDVNNPQYDIQPDYFDRLEERLSSLARI